MKSREIAHSTRFEHEGRQFQRETHEELFMMVVCRRSADGSITCQDSETFSPLSPHRQTRPQRRKMSASTELLLPPEVSRTRLQTLTIQRKHLLGYQQSFKTPRTVLDLRRSGRSHSLSSATAHTTHYMQPRLPVTPQLDLGLSIFGEGYCENGSC